MTACYFFLSKFKADNFHVAQMVEFCFDGVEKNDEQGENAGYKHFLPTGFSKG